MFHDFLKLKKMFDVLRDDGYTLHRHIIEIDKVSSVEKESLVTPPSCRKTDKKNPLLLCNHAENGKSSDSCIKIAEIIDNTGK